MLSPLEVDEMSDGVSAVLDQSKCLHRADSKIGQDAREKIAGIDIDHSILMDYW